MTDLEEFVAKTESLIQDTNLFIDKAQRKLEEDARRMEAAGINVQALRAQALREMAHAHRQPIECLDPAASDPTCRPARSADPARRRRALRAWV